MDKKILIEIVVKTVIVFVCVAVVAAQLGDYVEYNYGKWGRVALLLGTNITAIGGLNTYFAIVMPRRIKANFFKGHTEECLSSYQLSKRRLLNSAETFYANSFSLVHAIAVQEHLLECYTDRSLEADYIKIKHSLLTALAEEDSDKLLADMGRMKALLARFEYVYKK